MEGDEEGEGEETEAYEQVDGGEGGQQGRCYPQINISSLLSVDLMGPKTDSVRMGLRRSQIQGCGSVMDRCDPHPDRAPLE